MLKLLSALWCTAAFIPRRERIPFDVWEGEATILGISLQRDALDRHVIRVVVDIERGDTISTERFGVMV